MVLLPLVKIFSLYLWPVDAHGPAGCDIPSVSSIIYHPAGTPAPPCTHTCYPPCCYHVRSFCWLSGSTAYINAKGGRADASANMHVAAPAAAHQFVRPDRDSWVQATSAIGQKRARQWTGARDMRKNGPITEILVVQAPSGLECGIEWAGWCSSWPSSRVCRVHLVGRSPMYG
ncbi:hypothetical protein GGR56DRAFT_109785 [Xylariaceae sp. FL0804]|nr:hypothetical protein GGR56DRAFT_109785 [Xylariaceae sp. FL0804]